MYVNVKMFINKVKYNIIIWLVFLNKIMILKKSNFPFIIIL